MPRNHHITLPPNLYAPAPNRSVPPLAASQANGNSHSHPSLVTPQVVTPAHSHSAQNLHHPHQFPDASSTHRTPYPIPPYATQPPPNSHVVHNDYGYQPPQNGWSNSQVDYPMASPQEARPHVNGHPVDLHDAPMAQDPPQAPQDVTNAQQPTNASKGGKLGIPFVGKKHSKWGLGMFSGDKSHHHPALPPVDETSPAIVFTSRKRTQSSSTDSKSMRDISPIREVAVLTQDPRDTKKSNKKEAQRLHREAELEKRKMLERSARDQARAVLMKRQQMLRKNVGDDPEWRAGPEQRVDLMDVPKGKQPSSGPVRRDQLTNGNLGTVGAAAGKFAEPLLVPPEHWRQQQSSDRAKARRRDFDDDHSMSSSDVHSISRMSSISFATVDSDPGPSARLRNRPSLFGISRMTSRSSLRTSFDDFPPSARSSNSFSLEGQLAHDFRTQASVTSHMSGSVSPPPLQMLSLSPSMSPSLSPSPPWLHLQQQKDDLLYRTQSPPFLAISPRFPHSSGGPHSPLDLNGLPPLPPTPYSPSSSYGYPSSTGHTPKSSKSAINPMFKVVSYKWDTTPGLVPNNPKQAPAPPPPPVPPLPPSSGGNQLSSPNALPPFSQLEAVAGGGEYPPLSPMVFTAPEDS